MTELPAGTVTFLFTDIEGSTRLLHELGDRYRGALEDHRRLLREAFAAHGGFEVDTQGDAFLVAFPDAKEAVAAAARAQEALAQGPIAVRMGLHTGRPIVTDEGYVGDDVHRGARIAASGHGGQVVLSKETRELVGDNWSFTDLGEHRVKDFDQAVWIFQLGDDRFPSLKTISNTNLPRPAASFVGRSREVSEVASMLRDGSRLVTLTGPGGTGKTRLAIESASEVLPAYRNGVFWVGLATLRDPALVPVTIGQTLGAKDGPAEYIGEREMLLVLDNFEQVVDAAAELSSLLSTCPNLRLLVTSRELLRVHGEVEYAVPPLADPEAVDLFCTRAQTQVDQTIAELCRRLDNLPLAIELAAARTRVLSPNQILERLSQRLDLLKGGRDAEARQRTLRATIEWSYDLLDEEEKQLFARLAVFRGGCTLESAQEIADAEIDTLQSLVDKNLVRHRDERFFMLETIREFASEQLEETGEGVDLRRRHAEHFLGLAEEAFPQFIGSPKQWLERLDAEHDNLRAALDRLEAAGENELRLRLAGALYRFWYTRAHLTEGRSRLESALAADDRPTEFRANALNGVAILSMDSGDATTMKLRAQEALALHLELGNAWGEAFSRLQLGHALADLGDPLSARPLFAESLQGFERLGDDHFTVVLTHVLAWNTWQLGDLEAARSLHQENLRRTRASGNERWQARSLAQLAVIAAEEGRIDEAFSMLEEAYRIDRQMGEAVETALDICRFARTLAAAARPMDAVRLLSCAEAFRQEIGARFRPWAVKLNAETREAVRSQLDEASFAEAWEKGQKLTVDEAVELALAESD